MAKMKGDKPNYFQGHRICMDQNNSLQLNKSQLNSFTKKLEHRRLTNIARQIEYFLEIFYALLTTVLHGSSKDLFHV